MTFKVIRKQKAKLSNIVQVLALFVLTTLMFKAMANVQTLAINEKKINDILLNNTMVLEIAEFKSTVENLSKPDLIIQNFTSNSTYRSTSINSTSFFENRTNYQLLTFVDNRLRVSIKKGINNSEQIFEYTFESSNSGVWQAKHADNEMQLSGHFMLSSSDVLPEQDIAEVSHNNLTVAVNITDAQSGIVPKEYFPDRAMVLQSYFDNGKYQAIGFGPKAIPHHGTYTYEKITANVAIERTIQVMENSQAPFTMIYFYETPTSGRFFQNFGNGSIYFSGVFSTFKTSENLLKK